MSRSGDFSGDSDDDNRQTDYLRGVIIGSELGMTTM